MGLSEREQQLLEEMERHLYRSEADVMKTPEGNARLNSRFVVLGILTVVAGLSLLVFSVGAQMLWLGMIGFAVMFAGVLVIFSKKEISESSSAGRADTTQSRATRQSFLDRMNQRWDERMEGER